MSKRYKNSHFVKSVTEKDRSIALGEYIRETGATVRETAKVFGVSKSTVHTVVTVTSVL